MLPPEVQRIVLLVALAATGYLMILAWNEDSKSAKTTMFASDAPIAADADGGLRPPVDDYLPASGIPSPPLSDNPDVPDAGMIIGDTKPSSTSTSSIPVRSTLITVDTPTLKVWIDLVGGDIVRVQLPGYPVDLDNPDEPFLLLDRSQRQTYVAQSGLIGPDGPDAQGRPVYTSAATAFSVDANEEKEVVLNLATQGASIRKIFRFRGADHLVDVEYELVNESNEPKSAAMFAQIKRDTQLPMTQDTFALAPRPYLGGSRMTPSYLRSRRASLLTN